MKRKFIFTFVLLSMIMISTISIQGKTLTEYITKNGVEIMHMPYKGEEADSVFWAQQDRHKQGLESYYIGDHWKISTPDTTLYFRESALWGLVKNDFSSFFAGKEIADISELKRTTGKYADEFNEDKRFMDEYRNQTINDGILLKSENSPFQYGLRYDLSKEMFYVPINQDIIVRLDMTPNIYDIYKTSFPLTPIVTTNLINHFIAKDPRENGWSSGGPFFKLPIANKEVALMIEECQPVARGVLAEFEIYYYAKIHEADNPDNAHLTLEDILVVHTPTEQIVWSASEGDKSDEVILTE